MAAESPKHFFKQVLERGPYYEALTLLEKNPNLSASGRVYSSNHHYVHERSTSVEINIEGYLGDTGLGTEEVSITDPVYDVFTRLQEQVAEQCVVWNRKIEAELYAELEYQQKDETLIEWMNANDWRFDDDGQRVDMDDFMPIDNLKPGVRERVLREYADLFERTPEQVYASLMQRGYRFDKRGNRIDIAQFNRIDALDEKVRNRILDKNRDILCDDSYWAEAIESEWKEKLEALGFERVELRYSLGGNQGDGASFTSDTIDVKQLCTKMIEAERTQEAARTLATNLMA